MTSENYRWCQIDTDMNFTNNFNKLNLPVLGPNCIVETRIFILKKGEFAMKLFTKFCIFFLVAISINSCLSPKKKIISYPLIGEVSSLDPVKVYDLKSLTLIGQCYEGLFQYHYLLRPFKIIPLLAEGLPKVDKSGLIYTVTLKKNIPYHLNGKLLKNDRFVTAQDFINQIKRMAFTPLNGPGYWIFKGLLKGFEEFSKNVGNDPVKFKVESISGLKAVDEQTLVFELTRPSPHFLHLLTLNFIVPIPEEILDQNLLIPNDLIVGTGPFYLKSKNSKGYHLEKFESYRHDVYPSVGDRYSHLNNLLASAQKKIPFIDGIDFLIFNNEEEVWQSFLDKKLDIIEVPKTKVSSIFDDLGNLRPALEKKDIIYKSFPGLIFRWLAFNMMDPIVGKNKELREAIYLGIDKSLYNKEVKENTGLTANSIYPPGIEGFDPAYISPFSYNPEKSRQLMKSLGYGPHKLLNLTYSTRDKKFEGKLEADFLKRELAKIYINLNIEFLEFGDFLKKGRAGELQFFTDLWVFDYPDAQNLLPLLDSKNHPGVNKSGYKNKDIDRLIHQLEQEIDSDKKNELLRGIESEVENDIPWIPLLYEKVMILYHQKILNFRRPSIMKNDFKYIDKKD